MNLSCLLPLFKGTTAYKGVVEQLLAAENGPSVVILDAAKPYFTAALYDELQLPLMVITAQPEKARKLHEQLQIWCSPSADLQRFSELDFLLHEHPSSYPANAVLIPKPSIDSDCM